MEIQGYGKTIAEGQKGGSRKAYRAEPGRFDAAARYAITLAARFGEEIALVRGNSYGAVVWHIARLSEDLRRFTVAVDRVAGATVTPDGTVREATLVR